MAFWQSCQEEEVLVKRVMVTLHRFSPSIEVMRDCDSVKMSGRDCRRRLYFSSFSNVRFRNRSTDFEVRFRAKLSLYSEIS